MSQVDLTETILIEEPGSDIRSELDSYAPLARVSPVLVARIAPEALAHDALIGGLPHSLELGYILERDAVLSEEAAMHDEDPLVDTVRDGQLAEELREDVVHLDIVLLLDFSLEAVELVEVLRFVVASRHEHVSREGRLPGQKGQDDLH